MLSHVKAQILDWDVVLSTEEVRRKQEIAERKAKKEKRKQEKLSAAESSAAQKASVLAVTPQPEAAQTRKPVPTGPVAFVFPGQGSQAVGMLKVHLLHSLHTLFLSGLVIY